MLKTPGWSPEIENPWLGKYKRPCMLQCLSVGSLKATCRNQRASVLETSISFRRSRPDRVVSNNANSILGGEASSPPHPAFTRLRERDTYMHRPITAWVGLDISKQTFDACLLRQTGKPHHKQFDNSQAGFAKLLRWVNHLAQEAGCHFCMEATGAYGQALALFLVEAEQAVSVVNPFRVKHAALAYGQENKTDCADAHTLAAFCQKEQPALWRASAPEVRLLLALLRRLEVVQLQHQQEQNRRSEPQLLPPVLDSIQISLCFLYR